jgi:hypothetical protein
MPLKNIGGPGMRGNAGALRSAFLAARDPLPDRSWHNHSIHFEVGEMQSIILYNIKQSIPIALWSLPRRF